VAARRDRVRNGVPRALAAGVPDKGNPRAHRLREVKDAPLLSQRQAEVTVLGEYIDHHVKQEQKEIFLKVKKSDLDTKALGAELSARKEELMQAMDSAAEAES
jgi:hypothetical protein